MSRPSLISVKPSHLCLIALALCGLCAIAALLPALRAQEVNAPVSPRLLQRSRIVNSEATQIATASPEETTVAANPIPNARDGHTATLLHDGRVLVVGGRNSSGVALSSAQIYNPATGAWTAASSLATPRFGHVAVMLQNGRVLVAGGQNSGGYLRDTVIFNPVTGQWASGPLLNTARAGATATLLPTTASPAPEAPAASQFIVSPAPPADARVLIAGGENSGRTLASAELFNPAANGGAGAWNNTASMTTPRRDHTATLAPGGFVVITGGRNGSTPLKSVEMYFPNNSPSPIWFPTTNMSVARYAHTATALENGRVLVVGGHNGTNYLSDAALFDPKKRTWEAARNLNTARRSHSTTLLASGKVYVAGGFNGGAINTAETYDPKTDNWTQEQLSAARSSHTATILASGSVLLVAGNTDDNKAVIDSTELIDPAAGFWASSNSNTIPLFRNNSVLLGYGMVLSMGGLGFVNLGSSISLRSIANSYLFYPQSNNGAGAWYSTGTMKSDRYLFTATLLKTREVLVAGGLRGTLGSAIPTLPTVYAEIYDPSIGEWVSVNSMSVARSAHTATALPDGRVLVVGGFRTVFGAGGPVDVANSSAEIYNPATRSWTSARSMRVARHSHTAVLLPNGRVLVAGGFSGQSLRSAEIYDPATNTWTNAASLNVTRDTHTMTLLPNGMALVVGGVSATSSGASALSSAELYDPNTNSWVLTGDMGAPRYTHTATLLPSGKVLVVGGVAGDDSVSSNYLGSAQVYDPATGAWRTTGGLGSPRAAHTAVLTPDGQTVIIGGLKGPFNVLNNWLANAQRYDPGLGYTNLQRPFIAGVEWEGLKGAGSALKASGVLLQGTSEASGDSQSSSTNYPLVQLRSLDSERVIFLPPGDASGWANNFFTSRTIADSAFPDGFALLMVFTNGSVSQAEIIQTNNTNSTTQSGLVYGSIAGRVKTRAGTPLADIIIRIKGQAVPSLTSQPGDLKNINSPMRTANLTCSDIDRSATTGADGGFYFDALPTRCRYTVTPQPTAIGNLRVNFTPAQRTHFLPCNSCQPILNAIPNAPDLLEQGDDTNNQQHVTGSDFIADFVASVTGRVTLAGTTSGIGNLPMTLTRIPPFAVGDADRDATTSSSTGTFTFAQVALGGHYRLSANNSASTNYEFTYSPPLGTPVPGNSVELHEVDQNEAGRDFTATPALATPTIASFNPLSIIAGGPAFPLTVTGGGFAQNVTQLRWNDQPRTTTVNSPAQLTATIIGEDIALGGSSVITIVNQSGGNTRTSQPFPVTVNYPTPSINSLSPSSASVGGGPLTLTIAGAGFFPTSQVFLRGQARAANFNQATRNLSVNLAQGDLSSPGAIEVKVSNPAPGGGESNARNFQVTGFSISGAIRFSYGATPKLVPDVNVSLTGGSNPASATTPNSGSYSFTNLGVGSYVVTPSKTGDVNGVSGADASLVARAFAELITLNNLQGIAADANGSGGISGSDASLIAKFAADIPDPTSVVGRWKFNPANRSYPNLNGNLTGQDFEAILVGDVNGSWTPPNNLGPRLPTVEPLFSSPLSSLFKLDFGPAPKMLAGNHIVRASAQAINVSLPQLTAASGANLTVPIAVGDLTGRGVNAYDFTLTFDQNVLQLQNPAFDQTGTLSGAMTIVPNTTIPGRLRLVAFGISDLTGAGVLLNLKFKVTGAVGASSPLTWQVFNFNEGDPPANRVNGAVTVIGPPLVTTSVATNVTTTTATLNGSVNPNGGVTTAFFEWGTNSDLSNPQTTPSQSIAAGNTAQPISATLTGLNPGTTYYFRAVAMNSAGTTRGSILNFTTQVACPTVTGVNPASGTVGSNVIITGTNFTGVTGVKFTNNVAATPTNITDTSFNVVVPAGAITGPITINKTNCPGTQTVSFTVLPSLTLSFGVPALNVLAGESQNVALKLSAAQGSDITVSLNSANASVASVPAMVTIPAGMTEVPVSVAGVAVGGPVVITATAAGGATADLSVRVVNIAAQVINVAGLAGGMASVPIQLVSPGNVNAIGFSIQFDPAVLTNAQATAGADAPNAQLQINDSQLAQGCLGLILALSAGQQFAAGARQIVKVNFDIPANVSVASTPIAFVGQPTPMEVSDSGANLFPAAFIAGVVAITQGVEADVSPQPAGDGKLSATDWAQVGRFVAGLDAIGSGGEFQRADCAPRLANNGVTPVLGDGLLSVRDWVQAGRYAAGLDPPTGAGGPTTQSSNSLFSFSPSLIDWLRRDNLLDAANPRVLRLTRDSYGVSRTHSVTVELNAAGGESALGFSLAFDPARWRLISIAAGRDAKAARFVFNTNGATKGAAGGRIGIVMALPPGESLTAGVHQLITLSFASLSPGGAQFDQVGFADEPVAREITDAEANPLPTSFALNNDSPLTVVSSANFDLPVLASESLATAFGRDLADETLSAETQPLPTTLGGTRVIVRDSQGVEHSAPILFVSPDQINFQVPAETALGPAMVTITDGNHRRASAVAGIERSSPALFAADASGHGLAAGVVMRVRSDGSASFNPLALFDPSSRKFIAAPIEPSRDASEQVFLILFGTGVRGGEAKSAIIGRVPVEITYAGAQGSFAGLDQINIPLTREMIGKGELDVVLIVDGKKTNAARVHIK